MPVKIIIPEVYVHDGIASLWKPNHPCWQDEYVLCEGHLYKCNFTHVSSRSFKNDSLNHKAWTWIAKYP